MTRRRWVYTEGGRPLPQPVEVGGDYEDAPRTAAHRVDLYMDGVRATDGTDIGSKAKRREYMKRNNLADADDFKGTWAKAAEDRARFYGAKGHDRAARREAIGRAIYNMEAKGRRR